MSQAVTIGMIGLDTSHVPVFGKLLHDADDPHHVPGGRIVAAYPGGAADWPASIDRVPGYAAELESQYGTKIVDRPEQVADAADLVFIMTIDGRCHRELLERVLPARKPVFVDKPFAASTTDAGAMIEMAHEAGVPLMSCSSLRYSEALLIAQQALEGQAITGAEVFTPLTFQDALPGLFWYGCHGIEMIVSALGVGCERVTAINGADHELFLLDYPDGRRAVYRGFTNDAFWHYGAVLNTATDYAIADVSGHTRPYYANMLEAILGHLPQGRSPVAVGEMYEAVRVIEACNAARQRGEVVLDDLSEPLKGSLV